MIIIGRKLNYNIIKEYINNNITGNGCTLLTTEEEFNNYKNENNVKTSFVKIKILCKCNKETFNASYNEFTNKKRKQCKICSKLNYKSRAFPYEYVKNFIEIESNSGCKLISEKYINMNELLLLECKCGNKNFRVSFSKFKLGGKRKCNKCNKRTGETGKWNKESIKEYIEVTRNSKCEFIDYVKNKNDYKLYLKCRCGNEFTRYLQSIKNDLIVCEECSIKLRSKKLTKTQEEFEKEIYQLVGDEYTVLGKYINADEKILMRHNNSKCKNHEWKVIPYNFLSNNSRCPKCQHGSSKKTTEEFKQEVYNLVENEYNVVSEYKGNNINIKFLHKICNDTFEMTPHNFLSGQRCTICEESKGERVIRYYCDKSNIYYISQHSFEDCKNIKLLRFDFAIFWDIEKTNLKCLIEYDGEFHYLPIDGWDKLMQQTKRDNIKNTYCKNNNIPLIRIPYWEFDNIEEILAKELEVFNIGE